MKHYQRISAKQVIKGALEALKREFRKWYGTISVQELASNRELAIEIRILEQMLARQGV